MISVATTQYPIQYADWENSQQKIETLVQTAHNRAAQCILLPEYAGIEIGNPGSKTDLALCQSIQPKLEAYKNFYQQMAAKYQIYIQPGSIPVASDITNRFYNRAYFFSPNGNIGFQDKLNLTASEKADGVIINGLQQTLFDTPLGKIGIAICYDSEFPELVRNFTRLGAKLILVPSYTPSVTSFNRVHYACHARALENQCYVLLSCAIHSVQFGDSLEYPNGQAGLYGPIDEGFPENGLLAQGQKNQTQTVHTTISYEKIDTIRKNGQVNLFEDFQKGLVPPLKTVLL